MEKLFSIPTLSILSGTLAIGQKNASLSLIYAAAAVLSLMLLIGCIFLVRKKRLWFLVLFSCVLIVNIGYTWLSVSGSLQEALMANRVAYLGSVFLPMSMLMIILNVTNTKHRRWLPVSLLSLAGIVFLIAASPGILDIYYKEVSFQIINGVATLEKVYGPLHSLYLIYLVGYFASMIVVIIRASINRTIDTTLHAIIIAMAVFVNIGVWLIEQLSDIEFEFLSVSYIISELFLLGIHLVMNENQRLHELIVQKDEALQEQSRVSKATQPKKISPEMLAYFAQGLETLTPTEKIIYDAHAANTPTKQILIDLGIKENTLKFHNKNIYGKLGVSSRKQLLEICRAIRENEKKSLD